MWHQFVNVAGPMRWQALGNVLKVGVGSCALSLADWWGLVMAAARLPAARVPANNQFFRSMAQGLICCSSWFLSMGSQPGIMRIARQRCPDEAKSATHFWLGA